MFVSAVVPAAGFGLRLGEALPKPLVSLQGKPIFIRTLEVLNRHPDIKEIILVVSRNALEATKRSLKKYRFRKVGEVVLGGARRSDSVRNGLKCISPRASLVLVHDAARPFVGLEMISRVIKEAVKCKAAIPGLPVKSTIKELSAGGRVRRTLARERLYEIQTPQVFQRELIIKAYKKFSHYAAADDASLVERLGVKVSVVAGSYSNIKITTPEDLIFARTILKNSPH
ncbi:2-C-methyl-D-erythritol 4-phosphate cytidylyltransferase [Candidatus Omnitrophota bacterium]